MIKSLTAIVTGAREREALRAAAAVHRDAARAIARAVFKAACGEYGPDWRVLASALLADTSTRAADYVEAGWREKWSSDKPERYLLAVRALDACAPGWRELSGRERKRWLDDLPPETAGRVSAYHVGMGEEERGRLAKWMRGKLADECGLLSFWLFDAKAEWAYRSQLARDRGERLLNLKEVAPALVVPGANHLRKKAAEYAAQTVSSYLRAYELWRSSVGEWREGRARWEREHPHYVAVRESLREFLTVPGGASQARPSLRRLRSGATEYYEAYREWLAANVKDAEVARQVEGWHREWEEKWADEPKPPTYSEIRGDVSGLYFQRSTGYRALNVAPDGEATAEILLPVDEGGDLSRTAEGVARYEWRTVRLRADPKLAAFGEAQVSAARVLLKRGGRVYLSFKTDDGVTVESPLQALPPELCAGYDARWVYQKASGELGRPPRTVIAVFPLREGAGALLCYHDDPGRDAPSRWKSLTGDARPPTDGAPRRAGYSGSARGARWRRFLNEKVASTGAVAAFGRPAAGQPFAVAESAGFRNRLRETGRRVAAAVVEQAREWGAELVVFDRLALRSTDDEALALYCATLHGRLAAELPEHAASYGMRASPLGVASRVQTCPRCGGRVVRVDFARERGETYSPFGERARCLACGACRTVEHLVARNLWAALRGRFTPARAVRPRVFECGGGVEINLADRAQVEARLRLLTPAAGA